MYLGSKFDGGPRTDQPRILSRTGDEEKQGRWSERNIHTHLYLNTLTRLRELLPAGDQAKCGAMDRRIAALLCMVLALPAYAVAQDMMGKGNYYLDIYCNMLSYVPTGSMLCP